MTRSHGPADALGPATEHFLVTRFNLPLFAGREPADESWLRDRWDLFRTYCAPSLELQDDRDFRWLLLLDSRTGAWLRTELTDSRWGSLFEPVYLDQPLTRDVLSALVRARTSSRRVITTRIDNDDSVPTDFVRTIKREVGESGTYFVNLSTGVQVASGHLYLRPYTKNPFMSLVEPVTDEPLLTVHVDEHFYVDRHAPVRNIRTVRPMWAQVVHGGNVANEVIGVRAPGRLAGDRFPALTLRPGRPGEFAVDVVVTGARVLARLARKPARLWELAVAGGLAGPRRPRGSDA